MNAPANLVRPDTFSPGEEYWMVDPPQAAFEPDAVPVRFVGYDNCPAFVIVKTGVGMLRCPREALFARSSGGNGSSFS